MKHYTNLNDAATQPGFQGVFAPGKTKIWYVAPEHSRDALMGHRFCTKHDLFKVDLADLTKTHILLGSIRTPAQRIDDVECIFSFMQGETWSPNGEARNFIQALGLHHTSMSVGDIIEYENKFYMVDSFGFVNLGRLA